MADAADPGDGTKADPEVLDTATLEVVNTALAILDPFVEEVKKIVDEESKTVYDLTNSTQDKAARRYRKRLKELPGRLSAVYAGWNQPRLEAAKAMRAKVASLTELVKPAYEAIDAQITASEAAEKAAQEKREQEDRDRIADIRKRITSIAGIPVVAAASNSAKLTELITWLENQSIIEARFNEFVGEAQETVKSVLLSLATLRTAATARELQQAELDQRAADLKAQEDAAEVTRLENEEAARVLQEARDKQQKEALESSARLAQEATDAAAQKASAAEQVAVEQQNINQQQRDAFEEEKRVANQCALIHGKVLEATMLESSGEIQSVIDDVETIDSSHTNPELARQLGEAKSQTKVALQRLLERAVAGEQIAEQAAAPAPVEPPAPVASHQLPGRSFMPAAPPPPPEVDIEEQLQQANDESSSERLSPEELAIDSAQSVTIEPPFEMPTAAARPSDVVIVHTLATAFGVSEAEAIEWIADMDIGALRGDL